MRKKTRWDKKKGIMKCLTLEKVDTKVNNE